jgi:hypothetical protein
MIKVWRLLSVSIVVAVCLGLMLVPAAVSPEVASAAPDLNCGIEVVPDITGVGYNQNFSVNISIIDTVTQDIAAWTVYMEFNTTLMHVTGINPCTMLPTGYAPDDAPGYPKWNNATGVLEHQSGTSFGEPYVNTSFDVMTVHFCSNNVSGIGSLDFVYINPIYRTWVEDGGASSVLNWTMVVNGTVKVGPPVLTVNVTPAGMGDVNITGASIPSSYPNTTTWDWDEVVNLTAVNSVPNWTFTEWSGDLTGSDNTTSITMDWDKSVTAHFAPSGTTATLEGHVAFPGRGTAPDSKWIEQFDVTLFEAGNLSHVIWTGNAATDNTGVFTIAGLTPDTYDIRIKGLTSVSELEEDVTLTAGNTTVVDFGTMREGDCNDDNWITGADRNLLYTGWGSHEGGAGWNPDCDLNADDWLTGADRNLMYTYWGQSGE